MLPFVFVIDLVGENFKSEGRMFSVFQVHLCFFIIRIGIWGTSVRRCWSKPNALILSFALDVLGFRDLRPQLVVRVLLHSSPMAFHAWYNSQKAAFTGLGGGKATMQAASEQWNKVSKEEKAEWKAKASGLQRGEVEGFKTFEVECIWVPR